MKSIAHQYAVNDSPVQVYGTDNVHKHMAWHVEQLSFDWLLFVNSVADSSFVNVLRKVPQTFSADVLPKVQSLSID